MPSARTCATDLATPHRPTPCSAPDVLRKERFGALWYRRADCSTVAIPPTEARLLVAAQDRSILRCYAEQGGMLGLDDERFARQVVTWREDGLLDRELRCRARVVDAPRSAPGLTAPLVTHLELTRACNLRCTHCYMAVATRPGDDELSTARLLALFAELQQLGAPLLVLAGGEPLLRPDLWSLLDGIGRCELDAWLCTNATLLDAEAAARLADSALRGYSISLDGPDASSHDAVRGRGQFERACRGIAALLEAGARDVKLRVTVTPAILDRLLEFEPLARRLGVQRVVFKPFSLLGEASERRALVVSRARWSAAVERTRASWPQDACPADFSDGVPTRVPPWLGASPRFGCVGGTTAVTVAHDGRVLGCGCVRPADAWSLRDRSLAECWARSPAIVAWRELQPGPACEACPELDRCGGACRGRALVDGSLQGVDPWLGCAEGCASG